jgi:hypothetical protein
MGVRFQMVVGARAAEEMNDLLFSFTDFRHSVSPSGISDSVEPACWMHDAEASASSDASASCYGLSEDVRVFAVIVTELKLIQVERQIFLTDIVVGADHATLEQRPKRFQIIGMYFAAHVLMRFVINMFVRECLREFLIASGFIRCNQADFVRHRIADEAAHSIHRSIFDDFADHGLWPQLQ